MGNDSFRPSALQSYFVFCAIGQAVYTPVSNKIVFCIHTVHVLVSSFPATVQYSILHPNSFHKEPVVQLGLNQ